MQQLAANRPDRHARRHAGDLDVGRPAAGREDDGAAGQRATVGFDDHLDLVSGGDAADPALLDELAAAASCGGGEGARQLPGCDEPVRFDQQTAGDAVSEQRLFRPRRTRVEQQRGDAAPFEHARGRAKRGQRRFVNRDVERAGAAVRNGYAAVGRRARDERVVQIETADGQVQQRVAFARLDERREDSGRCLRRAHADSAIVDDLD